MTTVFFFPVWSSNVLKYERMQWRFERKPRGKQLFSLLNTQVLCKCSHRTPGFYRWENHTDHAHAAHVSADEQIFLKAWRKACRSTLCQPVPYFCLSDTGGDLEFGAPDFKSLLNDAQSQTVHGKKHAIHFWKCMNISNIACVWLTQIHNHKKKILYGFVRTCAPVAVCHGSHGAKHWNRYPLCHG